MPSRAPRRRARRRPGSALASPRDSGSAADRGERGLDAAGRRLVRDDVEHRVSVVRLLHEPGDRDALGGELLRDPREHAGAVLDLEPQVERRRRARRAAAARACARRGRSGGSRCRSCRRPRPCRRRRPRPSRCPPAPGPSSVISRIASPWSMTALKAPSTAASGWWRVDERRADADVDTVADERRAADELHVHVERARGGDVLLGDAPRSPRRSTSSSGDARAERDRREDRHLRRRVEPGDVLGRVGLRVAEPLRLGERVARRTGPSSISREDEVRRPVDDAEHAVDVRDDERLAQHLDHRDRGADGRLEAELDAAAGGGLEQLGAAAGDELLVRRHDRACRARSSSSTCVAGRLDAAHHLGDERDRRVVADRRRSRR